MSKRYGMVYMGSKEKILHLINYVFQREYKKKYLIDLFCGGLSVSSFALQTTNFNVIANDLNHYVIALYKELLSGGENFNKAKFNWIHRDHFNDVRDYPEMFPEWYVGYVLNVWSFGCNQKDYLYAKDLEENKHALHQAIVFNDFSLMNDNEIFKGFEEPNTVKGIDYQKYPARRIAFMEKFKNFIQTADGTERMQHLERLEQIENLNQTEHLAAISKNTEHKNRLELFSSDWKILYDSLPKETLDQSFIYCDPPYENTKKYLMGSDFDYESFWQWFRDCPYPVYVSSYTAPDDIKPLNFDFKAQLLDNGHKGDNKPKKFVKENIYWNGKGNPEPMMVDLLFE